MITNLNLTNLSFGLQTAQFLKIYLIISGVSGRSILTSFKKYFLVLTDCLGQLFSYFHCQCESENINLPTFFN